MRISDWSSDVCSSDLQFDAQYIVGGETIFQAVHATGIFRHIAANRACNLARWIGCVIEVALLDRLGDRKIGDAGLHCHQPIFIIDIKHAVELCHARSEEHTSELQSLMRISYAVFCLK